MAKHLPRKQPAAKTDKKAEELEILHPERILRFGDNTITVREYGSIEWLRLLPQAASLIDGIANLIRAGIAPTYDSVLTMISLNTDVIIPLVAQAAGMREIEIEALNPDEIDQLLMTWWGVNGRFFIQRAVNQVAVARAELRQALDGVNSSAPSSDTATSAPTSA